MGGRRSGTLKDNFLDITMTAADFRWANIKTGEDENGLVYSVRVLQVKNSETGIWENIPESDEIIDPEAETVE
jgi:hypothetical protein